MLMKWEDLMPGDKIRFSQAARNRFGHTGWFKSYDRVLEITELEIQEESPYHTVKIWFWSENENREVFFGVNRKGEKDGTILFDVVEVMDK